jgi:hypothetical protein
VPALPPVPKVIRLDFIQTYQSDVNVRNRIFFQYSGSGPSATDLSTWLTNIATAWTTNMRSLFTTNHTLAGLLATDLTTNSSPQVQSTPSIAGTRTTPTNSNGVALINKHRLVRRYRGGHSRAYWVAGNNNDITASNLWTNGFITSFTNGWAAFITAITTGQPASFGTITHVNVSYFQNFDNKLFPSGRQRAVPRLRGTPVVDIVASYAVNPKIGSQRRRNLQSA